MDENPFSLLPEALVEELLNKSESVGSEMLGHLIAVTSQKSIFRQQLKDKNLLTRASDLPGSEIPTTCGVDGSYVVERLMGTDLVACASVAIEGLVPPIETRYWPTPHHETPFIAGVKHHPDTAMLTQGLVWMMEIILAAKAPHDIIFLDGSMINPFTKVNAAMSALDASPELKQITIGRQLLGRFEEFIDSYIKVLSNNRSDKLWVGVPKHTSLNEIGSHPYMNWPTQFDDRAILSSILETDELIAPIKHMTARNESWHISIKAFEGEQKAKLDSKVDQAIAAIRNLHIIYYKPKPFIPALRIEVPASLKTNQAQLKTLLRGVEFQTQTPGIMEPYPLYMADRMAKSLGRAIPAFRQTITNSMATSFEGDLTDVFFNMHSYRSETGK